MINILTTIPALLEHACNKYSESELFITYDARNKKIQNKISYLRIFCI